MGNCLVTKLKDVVNNPHLLKLGEIRFKAKNNNAYFMFNVGTCVVRNINGSLHLDSPTGNVVTDGSTLNWMWKYCLPAGEEVAVSNKYLWDSLNEQYMEGSTEDYIYLKNLLNLGVGRDGSLAVLSGLHLRHFQINGSTNTDLIEGLSGSSNTLNSIALFPFDQTKQLLTMAQLAQFSNLASIEIPNEKIVGNTSLESYVEACRAAGKSTGTIHFTKSYIVYQDNVRSINGNVSWTSTDIVIP